MITSNDIPLGAKPLDRAAHHRTDMAWLDQAFRRPDVLVFLMKDGMPLMEGTGGPALCAQTQTACRRHRLWQRRHPEAPRRSRH